MKNIALLLFLLVICSISSVYSQCANVNLNSQEEVDLFFDLNPDCDSIGVLIISGDDIQNLHGLSGLKAVIGYIYIHHNPLLHDLKGLDSLVYGGSSFRIDSNISLQSLTGLESMTEVFEFIRIGYNPRLKDLHGLDKLATVSTFEVINNDSLLNLDGLEGLSDGLAIDITNNPMLENLLGLQNIYWGYLAVENNDRLVNLTGLENITDLLTLKIKGNEILNDLKALGNVTEIYYGIEIADNPGLVSLEGLDHLISAASLKVINNDALVDLQGVDQLERLTSTIPLIIDDNDALTSIEALNNLEYVYYDGPIRIRNNPNLTDCAILFFCQQLYDTTQIIQILNNGLSCNSFDEILSSCSLENSYATGQVYIDFNCNQVFDSSDVVLQGHIIESVENNIPLAATIQSGAYIRYIAKDDTLDIQPMGILHFTSVPASYQLITDTSFQVFDSTDFAFCPDLSFHDLAVTLTAYNPLRPGFKTKYQVCALNNGTFADAATLVFDFSNEPEAQYITILNAEGGGVISGQSVTWILPDVMPFRTQCFEVEVYLDPATPLGTSFSPHAFISSLEAITEIELTNNELTLSQLAIGSYDPNDKLVDPDTISFTDQETPLIYTIRFQNTGTFPATTINILDTLPDELNISSFEMISASHIYTLSFPAENIIQWTFDNINLPDSTSNEPLSHGFIQFKINARGLLSANTIISNRVSIYFDFNEPVVTDHAQTLVDLQIATYDVADEIYQLSVFPNPTSGLFQLELKLLSNTSGRIEILNVSGNIITSKNFISLSEGIHTIPLDLTQATQGVYFLRFLTDKGLITKKVVIAR